MSLDKRFYAGLPALLANAKALSNTDTLDSSDIGYLLSCIDSATCSLGVILEAFGRLVESQSHLDQIYRMEVEGLNNATLQLNTTIGGLVRVLSEITEDLHYAKPRTKGGES